MLNLFSIFLGGGIGASLRFLISDFARKNSVAIPYATLFINILGSFLLGFFIFYFSQRANLNQNFKLFLTVGVCGGFTTFSTFSYEAIAYLQGGKINSFVLYVASSLALCLLGAALGIMCAKILA